MPTIIACSSCVSRGYSDETKDKINGTDQSKAKLPTCRQGFVIEDDMQAVICPCYTETTN